MTVVTHLIPPRADRVWIEILRNGKIVKIVTFLVEAGDEVTLMALTRHPRHPAKKET